MEIGIVGSGNIGSTLAKQLKVLGHKVSIANSRGPATLSTVAAETGATAVTVEQAALAKDLIIISIPQIAVPRLPLSILRSSSAVIVDTGNYYPTRDGAIQEIDNGLAESQWVASVLGRPVVKAFNNIVVAVWLHAALPQATPDVFAYLLLEMTLEPRKLSKTSYMTWGSMR